MISAASAPSAIISTQLSTIATLSRGVRGNRLSDGGERVRWA